jgi:hypothetical protein
VKEYHNKGETIHFNRVRGGLVKSPEGRKWSSAAEYGGMTAEEQERRCGLRIDRVRLPADENARI